MSGKQLDENNIVNELKGSSLFFQTKEDPSVPAPSQKDAPKATAVPSKSTIPTKATLSTAPLFRPPQDASQHPRRRPHPVIRPAPDSPAIEDGSSFPADGATGGIPVPDKVPTVGSDDRTTERPKVRHTFDVLSDQLFALREIAVERERLVGRKVLLGDLVQEALDRFISIEKNHE